MDRALGMIATTAGASLALLDTGVTLHRWGEPDPGVIPARDLFVPSPVLVSDARVSLRHAHHPLALKGMASLAAVPVRHAASAAAMGSLWIGSPRPHAFTEGTVETLLTCTELVALALSGEAACRSPFRTVVDALPHPAVLITAGSAFLNPAMCRLSGYRGDELTSLVELFERLFHESASTVRALYAYDRLVGSQEPRVVSIRCADGSERMVEWVSQPIGESELWLMSDVSERVASQERFRLLFEQSSTALFLYDEHGVIDCNPAAVALVGTTSRSELVGVDLVRFAPPAQPDGGSSIERARTMEAIARDLGSHRFEWTCARADSGLHVAVEVTLTVVKLAGKDTLLAEWHDVSERAQVTTALTRARDAALHLANAKSEFLATMSHEIRTPMNGVIGMTRLLQDTALTAQQAEYVDTIRACGEGLLSLINGILDFSRLEAGGMQLEHLPFSPSLLTEDVVSVVASAARAKGLELSVAVDRAVPATVVGDSARVRQILLNLVSNAVKFTLKGAVTVTLTSTPDAAPVDPSTLTWAVRDTGVGIEPAALARLFSPFTQADASTTRRFGGTGLGLAISSRLAGLMGGIIDVSSSPAGSTFTFTVSLEVKDRTTEGAELAGRSVLVVARPSAATGLEEALVRHGATVESCDGAPTPVQLSRADAVLVDLTGPGERMMAAVNALAHRVVGVVAAGPAVVQKVEQAIRFAVTPPVRTAHLVAQLRAALDGPPVVVRATPPPSPLVGARVLVAEDNAVNQRVVSGLLGKLGCEVVVVDDGVRAAQRAAVGDLDAILMDCQMPVMDGLEATRHIRAMPGRHIPIIALTAGAMEGDRQRCLAAGMDDYLAKPLRLEDLERSLVTWLSTRRREEPGPAVEALPPPP